MSGLPTPSRPAGIEAAAGEVTLEGVLESVTFANEETGWSVVRIEVEGRRAPVAAVGNLAGVRPGECLRLSGRWERDRRFGAFSMTSIVPRPNFATSRAAITLPMPLMRPEAR